MPIMSEGAVLFDLSVERIIVQEINAHFLVTAEPKLERFRRCPDLIVEITTSDQLVSSCDVVGLY